jgi:3,4-dihydroxy 2-butanone 4-phosphate synthase / GTP cyclohydrolase II
LRVFQKVPAMSHFSPIEDAIEAVAEGRIVIVVDSEDRENEGDLIGAAERVTPEMIHFLITEGRGQLCVPVCPGIAERLDLRPMVPDADPAGPRFAVPVDSIRCHTGISPSERAGTVRSMVDPASRADDFVRPGHIFPLIARPGGVLERPGHAEAAVELAQLAGLAAAGILCEICSRDGHSMARGDELATIAAEFGLPLIAIDQLIAYRRQNAAAAEVAVLA